MYFTLWTHSEHFSTSAYDVLAPCEREVDKREDTLSHLEWKLGEDMTIKFSIPTVCSVFIPKKKKKVKY